MFDSSSLEMLSAPASEMAPPRKDSGPGIRVEQLKEITDFFADKLKEEKVSGEKSELLSLMAEAGETPDDEHVWELLAHELRGQSGIEDFTPGQLQRAMKGSPLFEKAVALMQDSSEPGEDVDVSHL